MQNSRHQSSQEDRLPPWPFRPPTLLKMRFPQKLLFYMGSLTILLFPQFKTVQIFSKKAKLQSKKKMLNKL